MGINRLRAVLGGTHLLVSKPETLPRVIERFEEFSIGLVGISDCTGVKAAVVPANHFGKRFQMAAAGSVYRF